MTYIPCIKEVMKKTTGSAVGLDICRQYSINIGSIFARHEMCCSILRLILDVLNTVPVSRSSNSSTVQMNEVRTPFGIVFPSNNSAFACLAMYIFVALVTSSLFFRDNVCFNDIVLPFGRPRLFPRMLSVIHSSKQ
jgi:hypothetical protein